MTHITLRFEGSDEPVTVEWLDAKAENPALQKQIGAILNIIAVKPIVNVEAWLARVLIEVFGGKIDSEPEFDPNEGDIEGATVEPRG